jgi:hypothetical protein
VKPVSKSTAFIADDRIISDNDDRNINVDIASAKCALATEEERAAALRLEIEALRAPSDIPAGCATVAERCELFCFSRRKNVVAHIGGLVYPSHVPFPKIPPDSRHRYLVSTSVFRRLLEQKAIHT